MYINGKDQIDLVKDLGFNKSTVSTWCRGVKVPRMGTIQILANYFNVDISDLVDEKDEIYNSKSVKIPVLGTVVAGIPLEAIEDIIDYEEISVEMARQGDYFALRVKGDSMEPKISAGDVVIVRKQEDVDSGDLAIVLVNGNEATIKKIMKFNGGINLVPNNSAYSVMTYTNEQIESLPVNVIGKVVELRAKF
ncbi:MAG TPA: helix-turn-helix domain-containing protein [Candidatus Eubacterium faecipullorum]|uniref:Helix-turn-helix domain-containing protein n=1 Tax=Candidatus Eubacterium faecipullorum TaxID=2838571 RepID=A0A9D1RD34_9FIRM|nr:helix-turn-helix domain-containing protein [Candidatus Eubacterium faecipullorum]